MQNDASDRHSKRRHGPFRYFRHGIRRFWERTFGWVEPVNRRFLREHEVKALLENDSCSNNIPEGVVNGVGYFRLWRLEDGTKALTFGQSPQAYADLKLALVHTWHKSARVHWGEITQAIDSFSETYRTAADEKGVLFETQAPARHLRSSPLAYRNARGGLKAYLNVLDADDLCNSLGKTWRERIIRAGLDPGIDVIEPLKTSGSALRIDPAKIPNNPEAVEDVSWAHFLNGFDSYFAKQNPIPESHRNLHPVYYQKVRFFWVTQGAKKFLKAKSLESIETSDQTNRIVSHIWDAVSKLYNLFWLALSVSLGASLIKDIFLTVLHIRRARLVRMAQEKWKDLHSTDRRISDRLNVISPFNIILRPVKREIFERATLIGGHAFNDVPRTPLNVIRNQKDRERAVILGPDIRPVPGSLVTFMRSSDEPSPTPADDVVIKRIRRPDGLNIIHLQKENCALLTYDRNMHFRFKTPLLACDFSPELHAYFDQAPVVEVAYGGPDGADIRPITKDEAIDILKSNGVKNPDFCLHIDIPPVLPASVFPMPPDDRNLHTAGQANDSARTEKRVEHPGVILARVWIVLADQLMGRRKTGPSAPLMSGKLPQPLLKATCA